MKRSLLLLAPLALTVASPARAATFILFANLSGANEAPPVTTPGAGTAVATLDDVAHTLTLNVNFSGLLSPTIASHIHCCAPVGTNAGVATTVPTFAGFPLGVTAGSFSTVLDLNLASSYNPAFVTANGATIATARQAFETGLVAGRSYLNIHTQQFPGGEIRGQLLAVPEPATWAALTLGFGLLAFAMRRRTPTSAPSVA